MTEEPIRKVLQSGNYEKEYFLCPKCKEVLEWGTEYIDTMYDDIVPSGEAEVDYLYCLKCGWNDEEKRCSDACEALGGVFWY